MIHLRSGFFNVAFFTVTAVAMVLALPVLAVGREATKRAVQLYARTILLLLKHLAKVDMEVRGRERLQEGACLIASKHQSTWETIAYMAMWPDPVFFLKRELFFIPFWGWYARRLGMIPIARTKGGVRIRRMVAAARAHVPGGRQLIIFPEGTRRRPSDPPDYKPGVAGLYAALQLPCVPVALNSGCHWGRRSFLKRPGRVVVEILEPIPPGLPRAAFEARLMESIEAATQRLVAESLRLSESGQTRIQLPPRSGTSAHNRMSI